MSVTNLLQRSLRPASRSLAPTSRCGFHSTSPFRQTITTTALPVRKPVGAFRGGILGFLLGSTASGAALYYYVIDEYKVSNELLAQDIYTLQSAVQRIETYVRNLEERAGLSKKQ